MTKDEMEIANATLAQQWCDNLLFNGVNLVDVLEYETRRVLGAICKQHLDSQSTAEVIAVDYNGEVMPNG